MSRSDGNPVIRRLHGLPVEFNLESVTIILVRAIPEFSKWRCLENMEIYFDIFFCILRISFLFNFQEVFKLYKE